MSLVHYFDPQPAAGELPARLASPFAHAVHPLARRAADELRALVPALGAALDAPGGGKMFGVLVVEARDGRIGYLRAFSGMLGGTWQVAGFAGPVFDVAARDAVWPQGEAELAAIDGRLAELARARAPLHDAVAAIAGRHAQVLGELAARHAANRAARHRARRGVDDPAARHAIDQQSRADTAERKRVLAAQRAERAGPDGELAALDTAHGALTTLRTERSRGFLVQIHDTYRLANARGELRALRAVFAPEAPPGGAGDCAAPKLFAQAYREQLRPLAIAELWLGAPPATGDRRDGNFYPACRGKCGPVLAHVLDGLAVDPPPVFGAAAIADDEPRLVFEDDWLVVVDKPCGLLSVPGRSGQLRDSVLVRLRRRYPDAGGPLLVHRLDLDASGLLLAAKRADTHAALQALFARRQIDKRYIAWLDGTVAGDRGTIELALRVDVDDRPRQIHDPIHGKPAVTEWHVLARTGARTRVALHPRTGRTHQLRVHAAVGLNAPIVGDRLYGTAGPDRLQLHAESLRFVHPHTHQLLTLERPAPF